MKVASFEDIKSYLTENGLIWSDFRVHEDINTVELNKGENHEYFISVGGLNNGTFEVFAHSVGAMWKDDICIKDGKLVQYKVFKSLKRALDFALKARKNGTLPDTYIKAW